MPKNHYNIIVLGGGCTALNFAIAYANSNLKKSVLILEQRSDYQHDRNWSFWLHKDETFDHRDILKATWQSWRFSAADTAITHSSYNYEYATISSGDFYQKAQDTIRHDERIRLEMNCSVNAVTQAETLQVNSSLGVLSADFVIDTRNLENHDIQFRCDYYQIFYGYEIEAKHANFDYHAVGLMDQLKTNKDGVSFIYTLPFSNKNALVEYTLFTKSYKSPNTLEAELQRYLKDHNYTVKYKEKAVLPMGHIQKENHFHSPNYIHVGGASGALRESSGYGFLRLYNWGQEAVSALEEELAIPAYHNKSLINVFLDRHFVKTLRNSPMKSDKIFMALAKNCSADLFARFMTEKYDFLDALKIILSVPKGPFLKALFQK